MRLSLITKLTIATSLILLIFMALFAYINLATLKKLLLEEAISDADKMSETIIKTTHHQMLQDDRERAYQMMREVGEQKGLDHIRMINKDGRIIFSTHEDEIGTFLDKKAEACNMCHAGEQPLTYASSMNRSRIFFNKDGNKVLGLAKAIYNEESCYLASCHFHPEYYKVLGVLDIIVSLEHSQSLLSAFRNKIIALTLLMLALLWLSMTFFSQKLVNQPVKFLLQHTKLLARGEMDASVKHVSNDELGELADAFNAMTLNLRMARNELEEWGRNLEVKVEERTREVKQIQAQLIRSEKLASLGELVAGIAHEINNPLTGIMVFTSLISSDPKLAPELRSDLETITRQAERCARIVKGLLEFSRETTPQKQPASLNNIMDATFSLIGNQACFHDINVCKHYADDLPDVLVDPNQIEQVLVNIVMNASHAMPEGGEMHITSGISPDGLYVYMKVSDSGCGIPEENLKRIFDPFFTTKENKGTGLGLSVSYGIMESHGGKIEVESTVGVGTTFTVKVPLAPSIAAKLSTDKGEPVVEKSQDKTTAG